MNVLFVIPSITNYFTFLEELVVALSEAGHTVHLATSRRHIAEISVYRRAVNCTVHHIDFPRAIDPIGHHKASRELRRVVDRVNPDVINVHFSAALFTTALAKKKSWPLVTGTIHGLGSPLITGWRKLLIAKAESWSAKKADEVYVLTEEDRHYLKENAPSAQVNVLDSFGVGCELERFDPEKISEEKRQEIRQQWGIGKTDFVYIFIGRQTHFKGFDKVVRAFIEVKKTHPNSKLLLVGEKDRIHPTALDPGTEQMMAEDAAFIHVGWRENVQDFLSVSHLNVFPSEREGLPVNLMESLAMGVPVITVDSRGCRDVVQDGENGMVLKNQRTEVLSQAMRQLQDDQALLKSYSKAAFEGRKKFDRSQFIDAQLKIMDRLTRSSA